MTSARAGRAGALITGVAVAAALGACGGHTSGGTTTRTGTRPAIETGPVSTIAFRRFFDANQHTGAIFTMRTDGTGERQVSHPGKGSVDSFDGPPAFTPDGATLVFDRTDANGNGSLWRVGVDGTGERRLKTIQGFPGDSAPTVSPDGRLIAIGRAYGKHLHGGLKTALYVMSIDGSHARAVAPFGYRADVTTAAWSPDGRRIVFAVIRNDLTANVPDASALFTVRPDGGGLHRLTDWRMAAQYAAPDYSPDGRMLLFQVKPL
jgi:TolB protein